MGYKLLDRQHVFRGQRIGLEIHHMEDEVDGSKLKREVCTHPGAVVILPLIDEQTVMLIRNHRWAVGRALIELPAGTLEPGEIPMNAAGRELQEETGYLARRMKPLINFYASPGVLTERLHVFVASDLQHTGASLDAGEEIELMPTRYDDALDMIDSNEIEDAKTIASLLVYDRKVRRQASGA